MKLLLTTITLFAYAFAHTHDFTHDHSWPHKDHLTIGDGHGEIAVNEYGNIYISVQGGPNEGIQIFSPEGEYLGNVVDAPSDFHGFVIIKEADTEFIYGARLGTGEIMKMDLNGKVHMNIPHTAVPEEFLNKTKDKENPEIERINPRFTGIDVAPDGRIYIVDGYGNDNIHVFSPSGEYQTTFVMREAPFNVRNLHKIYIDPRYDEPRIIGTDRQNDRIIHLSLEGEWIGEHITGLRRPSAIAFYGDKMVVGEIRGRITVFDKAGNLLEEIGTNEDADMIGHNRATPDSWHPGIVNSPHGIAFDAEGNVLMTEYSRYGRIIRYNNRLSK